MADENETASSGADPSDRPDFNYEEEKQNKDDDSGGGEGGGGKPTGADGPTTTTTTTIARAEGGIDVLGVVNRANAAVTTTTATGGVKDDKTNNNTSGPSSPAGGNGVVQQQQQQQQQGSGARSSSSSSKRKADHVDATTKNTDGEDGEDEKMEDDDDEDGGGRVIDEDDYDEGGGDEDPAATKGGEGDAGGNSSEKNKNGKGTKSITRIRYSNDFKVKVLDELEVSNVTVAEMARRHKLPEATLRDWVKTKDKITTAQVNRRGSAKSNSRDNLQKVTDALRTYMDLNDRLGVCGMSKLPITNALIAKQGQEVKALLLEKDQKKPFLTAQERKTLNAFNASIWWSKKWARKHNLHSVGHREAAKAAAQLSSQIPKIRQTFSKDHVFFVVDTMLFYKCLPTRSFIDEEASVGGGPKKYLDILKDRLSLFICSNSSGSHKIPLTMVSDKKDPSSFVAKRQKVFPYMYQENAWANPKMLLTWWKDVFLPDIRAWTEEKVLLVLQKPSIVDLDDPQDQVSVKFLPPLLANNHNNTSDGLSISSFFEPPIKMLSVVRTKYRYALLKEVFQIFEERSNRRLVASTANLSNPGLKQGHLPHLQDCMRILDDVWNELPASSISSEDDDGDGKKRRRRKKRKKKGTTDEDIIENDSMVFSDELGTDELIKQIVHFFRKNDADVQSLSNNEADLNAFDKSVAEVKRCFVNEKLLLKSNQDQLRKILDNWVGLEESQDIRAMLQEEIRAGMKFRLIVGVDKVDEDDEADQAKKPAEPTEITDAEKLANEVVAMDVATQLLQCAVRLSKESSAFHDLASKLVEASDAAFVSLRLSKLPPELREPKIPQPPKKRKPRTLTGPRKKRVRINTGEEKSDNPDLKETEQGYDSAKEKTQGDAETDMEGEGDADADGEAAPEENNAQFEIPENMIAI